MPDKPFAAEHVFFTVVDGGGMLTVCADGSVREFGAAVWQCGMCCQHVRREEVSAHATTRHLTKTVVDTPQVEIQVPGSEVMERIKKWDAGRAVGFCGNCGAWDDPATHKCALKDWPAE